MFGIVQPTLGGAIFLSVDLDLANTEPFENLAWTSQQVVVARVIKQIGPRWAEPHWWQRTGSTCLEIVTDYVFEIETQYRGEPAEKLRVRVPGGEIGNYKAEIGIGPDFGIGDRLLLFLTDAPQSELLPNAYAADIQRAWWLDAGDRIKANSHLDPFEVTRLDDVEDRIRNALEGSPPEDLIGDPVPLEDAPIRE